MKLFHSIRESLLHLAFPRLCGGCGSDALPGDQALCACCLGSLPETGFHRIADNPAERVFWGRLPLRFASAQYYFSKDSVMQRLMHEFKYHGHRELGFFLGRMMGTSLQASPRLVAIDALVPLPLHPAKEQQRGFNQAKVLCEGIAEATGIPVWPRAVIRTVHTESQTRKGRTERWENMEGRFGISDPGPLANRHLLLVDDVLTTGASLEACGRALLAAPGVALSVATLCFSAH